MDDITVLVVDDSVLIRNLVSKVIDATSGMSTVATAMNGEMALGKIPTYNPDVIILDLNMPVMNGLEFMKERKKQGIDIPVIIFSGIAHTGAAWTMECLELGASDFLFKPSESSDDVNKMGECLVKLIQSYGGAYARKNGKNIPFVDMHHIAHSEITFAPTVSLSESVEVTHIKPLHDSKHIDLIAIGISTGGPNALREVFANISPDIHQPIVVVQHMPVGFTAEFANSLNNICPLEVKEAEEGDVLKKGYIFIAPGDKHIVVEKKALASLIRLSDAPPCNGHRPSADVLFESVAKEYPNTALGIIMTGMGRDGATQLAEMRRQGSRTLGQDAESSVVYGMPRVAYELGAVEKQVSLAKMAEAINKLALGLN